MMTNIKLKTHIVICQKIRSFPRKHNRINRGNFHKGFWKLLLQAFNSNFSTLLDINTRDVPNFIRTSLSTLNKSYLEIIREKSSKVLKIRHPILCLVNIIFKLQNL